ncbi:MAG: NADH:ubiquinone reductase (Na(+)-transporting) subunit B [Candidatus Marinimicrobia bacterium]|nr:NADH:ubiquinone reductase (Na(+)-transporting) subunit B [Candidatus Neomarinimicrobiota bacterium]
MTFLRKRLDKVEKHFIEGGKLEKLHPLYDAIDTFLFVPGYKTVNGPHVRDSIDLKRSMIFVVIALLPCLLFGIYNTGYQSNLLYDAAYAENSMIANILNNLWVGLITVLPIVIVVYSVGGLCEAVFSIVRKHEINEGFLVTGMLIPLTLPPDIPLWMVGVATFFGIVIGKEIFGGTGYNVFNPALLARAFLFFAYPAHMSGDKVWVVKPASYYPQGNVDYITQATPLGELANAEYLKDVTQNVSDIINYSWWDMFVGFVPGSIGETSAICILLGALFLIATGIGSWRTMMGCIFGMLFMTLVLNYVVGPLFVQENLFLFVGPHWHLVIGSFAFGTVFMATDPVSSAHTEKGRYYYGFLIGVMGILIRVLNPAYPEGMMLAILFANAFAPLIDYYVVKGNIKRRELRSASR